MSNAGSFSPSSMESQPMDLEVPLTEEQIMNITEIDCIQES